MNILERIRNKIYNHHLKLKGQYTMYALFMTVITIVAFTAIYPMLKQVIDDTIPTMGETEGLLLSLSPLFIFLFILYSAMWYVVPHREER